MTINEIAAKFDFPGKVKSVDENKIGHINRTYQIVSVLADGSEKMFILQRINTYAFKKPEEVMSNILGVTAHLKQAMIDAGEDPDNRVLECVLTHDGKALYHDDEGQAWRAYVFIHDAVVYSNADDPAFFREAGAGFGKFQRMLMDYPIDKLFDTIPDFHNTVQRVRNFENAVKADAAGRAAGAAAEIEQVRVREKAMGKIVEMIDAGELPLRVTHNDTKINNVMMDAATGKALCVIDLDTVMAGSSLYDFGDAIRSGATTAAEDEADLSKVEVSLEYFEAFADGYLSQTADVLTENELKYMTLGALVMTYEVGMRFLTDYLENDVYFRTLYPEHNLVRARNQLKLVASMEAHRDEMDAIIGKVIAKYAK